jgi:abequosyltransferase
VEASPATVPEGSPRPRPRLAICISTFNRADFVGATLDSIIPQLTADCELVVLDNASSDGTDRVVAERALRTNRLRYVRNEVNRGIDGNFDRAIEVANAEYCWPMPDDDLVNPGAVAAVLKVLSEEEPSLVLLNYEFRDFTLRQVWQRRVLDFDADRIYGPWERDRMFVELGDFVRYIGAMVMSRELWLARRREHYWGSYYAFVAMIFQEPLPRNVYVVATSCVSYRAGNENTFAPKIMEIVLTKWPSLVAALPVSAAAKRTMHSAEPWKHSYELLFWRGRGIYTMSDYRQWVRPQLRLLRQRIKALAIAALPALVANSLLIIYLSLRPGELRQMQGLQLGLLKINPFNWRNHRARANITPQKLHVQATENQ